MVNPDGEMMVLYVIVGMLLVFAVVAWIARRANRRRLEMLKTVFERGSARNAGLFGSSIVGFHSGFQCRYTVHPRSNNSPGGAILSIPVVSPHEWSVSVSGAGSRLMVKAGVLKDHEIGDPEIDSSLRCAAADPTVPAAVFADQRARVSLKELVSTEHFRSVTLRNARLVVRWVPYDKSLEKDAEAVATRLRSATTLAQALGLPPG